jgi:hypothetical protein
MEILIDGNPIPDTLHVMSVSVNRELNRIPSASIQIDDGEAAKATFPASNSDSFLPGKSVEIKFGYRSQNETVFKGTIVKQHLKVRKAGGVLSIDCCAAAVKMTSARKSKYFVDMKDSDIMEQILDAWSLQADVEATSPDLKQVVQYDSTDWDFLLCRAEANGQVVLVGDDKITVAKPDAAGDLVLQITYGSTVLELDVEMDARLQSKGIKARTFPTTGLDATLIGLQNILAGYQCGTVYKPISLEVQATTALALYLRAEVTPPDSLLNGSITDPQSNASVPAVLLTPERVTTENMNSTVIVDKLYSAAKLCAGYAATCAAAGISG